MPTLHGSGCRHPAAPAATRCAVTDTGDVLCVCVCVVPCRTASYIAQDAAQDAWRS